MNFGELNDFMINCMLFAGIVGLFTAAIMSQMLIVPRMLFYRGLAVVCSAGLLLSGMYFKGSAASDKAWILKNEAAKVAVTEAENNSAVVTSAVERIYVDKIKVITKTATVIQEKIVEAAPEINAGCTVSPAVIEILNEAAANPVDTQ